MLSDCTWVPSVWGDATDIVPTFSDSAHTPSILHSSLVPVTKDYRTSKLSPLSRSLAAMTQLLQPSICYVPNNVKFLRASDPNWWSFIVGERIQGHWFCSEKARRKGCSAPKPEHIDAVRHSMLQSPDCSARKHGGFLDCRVC